MTNEQYKREYDEFAYNLFKAGKSFRKSRCIIIKDDKLFVIHRKSNNFIGLPGGGIESGENAYMAAKREAMEETGILVKPLKIIDKSYFNVDMKFGTEKFVSKRVEFYVLCEYVKKENNGGGLEGEFDKDGIEILMLDENELGRISHISKKTLNKISKLMKKNKLCK